MRVPDDSKQRAASVNVEVNGKTLEFKLNPESAEQQFSFESAEEAKTVRFTLVPEEGNKGKEVGAAFQVLGDLEQKDIPKDLSSVDSGMYAGCTCSESENGCASAFTGQMVMDNKNMFVSKQGKEGEVYFQVDFKSKVKITHIEAITDDNRKVASFQYLNSDKNSQTFTFGQDKT